jgi:hypothetical protein
MFDPLHKWLGIPASEQPPNHYRLLGIPLFEDDPEVIDAAADKHLAFLHDMSNGEHGQAAEELSNQVSAARLRLLNRDKKDAYDQQLREQLSTPRPPVAVAPEPGFAPIPVDPAGPPPAHEAVVATPVPAASDSEPLVAVPVSQVDQGVPTPGGAAEPLVKRRKHLRPGTSKDSRSARRTWLYLCGPASIAIVVLLVLIAMGKLRLDRNKMESIGVPPEQAAWIAGESNTDTDLPDQDAGIANVVSAPEPRTSPSPGTDPIPSNAVDSRTPAPPPQVDPNSVAIRSSIEPIPTRPPPTSRTVDPSMRLIDPDPVPVLPTKHPLPSDADVDKKMSVVRELFEQQYRSAKTSEEKLAVARQMIADAEAQAVTDPVGQYALWRVARDIFMAESDFESSFDVADQMSHAFADVDVVELKSESIRQVKTVIASKAGVYANAAFSVATQYMQQGQFRKARSICTTMRRLLRTRLPSSLAPQLQALETDIENAEELFDRYQSSALVLEADPSDRDAQTVAGTFLCCVENRWDEGLPRLAEGSDDKKRLAATRELGQSENAITDLQIADAWYEAAQQAEVPLERRRLTERAAQWYESAQPGSQGLELMKIDRRLKELSQDGMADSGRSRTRRIPPRLLDTKTWNSNDYTTDFARIRGNVITVGMGKTSHGAGEACAGIELEGAETIKVVGAASHKDMLTVDGSSKSGFVIDYRRKSGGYKRVFLGCGMPPRRTFTDNPPWGSGRAPDGMSDLGRRTQYTIDLKQWEPSDWDGNVWFSVYMINCGSERMLAATVTWAGPSE